MTDKEIKEYRQDGFFINTDREQLDIGTVHEYLCGKSYWAQGRSLETVKLSIENSLCFGVYEEAEGQTGGRQVGFARVVTDYATFAWLCDLYIDEAYTGRGLGKWLVECIGVHPGLQRQKLFILATKDAHDLYRRYGNFEPFPEPQKWMLRKKQSIL